MLKVGVNGYGTIGRRVAHAISIQDDMKVVGIVKTRPDYISKIASREFSLYVPDESALKNFTDSGIRVAGTLANLMDETEAIVDCTPEGQGEENLPLYRKHGKRAIFQGGEEAAIAEASFNAYANYDESSGKNFVRVVSCNTTGLARTLAPVKDKFGIRRVNATLIRRATDQNDSSKGPINAIEPSLGFPSHHAPDLKTVLGNIDVDSVAIKVPTTLMHVHSVEVTTKNEASASGVLDLWKNYRRIIAVSGKDGRKSTAQIMDMARELGRNRSDLYEIAVWKESVYAAGNTLRYIQAIHQESDVVPENVDALRSMFEIADREKSISATDTKLGIGKEMI
ncbi:MAG: type II glyceraldehyde-3-phosphate dehydrogenase [Thermoplasmataceae archaeon]